MLGYAGRGRWAFWIGAFGAVLIVIALVSPGTQSSGAQTDITTRSGRLTSLVTSAAPAPVPLPELRVIVVPANGGDLPVFDTPGAPSPSQVLPAVNELGNPLVLLAVEQQGDWYRVLLQSRPNGSSAWVPLSSVTATAAPYAVEVSLSSRSLQVVRRADDAVVLTSPIGIGSPSTPTPTGLFYVREHFPTDGAPDHPYGPYAFGLSGHSDVYAHFGTGDGRIAIHGTNDPASIGASVSNGCVHVPNDVDLALIPLLPPGTPVTINA
jgi:lipoprotein-anchoring transpeptidase ErfK/SrfK